MHWCRPGSSSAPAATRIEVFAALEHLEGAKGRLELVGERNGAPVFVDYAHKPDALAKALQALRPYARRKLVVVFGAGGDRDTGKRPLMGEIAADNADVVIVTDDNPRSENPAAIRAAILAAARAPARSATAPKRSVRDCGAAAGRRVAHRRQGPRDRTDRRRSVLPFSDHEAAIAALASRVRMSSAPLVDFGRDGARRCAPSAALCRTAITGISIDSRTIAPGEAYFAIKGDVHDGHAFVDAALKAGAALAVVAAEQARTSSPPMRRC